MAHATKATLVKESGSGARTYRTEFSDGRVLTITVPGAECRACGGDGRAWSGRAFTNRPCPICKGTGEAR